MNTSPRDPVLTLCGECRWCMIVGVVYLDRGDWARARDIFAESLSLRWRWSDPDEGAQHRGDGGLVAWRVSHEALGGVGAAEPNLD